MSNYRNSLEAYLKTLDIKTDNVADVGGGALPVKDRVKSWLVKEYDIWDNGLDKDHFKVGRSWLELDMNKPIEEQITKDFEPYDIVFCLEVMEYVHNPRQAIVNLNYLTRPGGILYITFPFLYPIHEPKEADSLRYTGDAIGKLLGEQKFKILDMIPRLMTDKGFELYKDFMKVEGMHSSKHSRHDVLGWIVKAIKP